MPPGIRVDVDRSRPNSAGAFPISAPSLQLQTQKIVDGAAGGGVVVSAGSKKGIPKVPLVGPLRCSCPRGPKVGFAPATNIARSRSSGGVQYRSWGRGKNRHRLSADPARVAANGATSLRLCSPPLSDAAGVKDMLLRGRRVHLVLVLRVNVRDKDAILLLHRLKTNRARLLAVELDFRRARSRSRDRCRAVKVVLVSGKVLLGLGAGTAPAPSTTSTRFVRRCTRRHDWAGKNTGATSISSAKPSPPHSQDGKCP